MKALVPMDNGVEEMEAVVIVDALRRAGWHVTVAALSSRTVRGARDIQLVADAKWADVDPSAYDLIVLPGGERNTAALAAHAGVLEAIRVFYDTGRLVAAICAAPLALQAAGILEGRKATCHPGVRESLTAAKFSTERVVVDKTIVTSQGPGTALEFALTLVRLLDGQEKATQIAEAMVL